MNITLSPMRGLPGQAETLLSVAGDVLTVDNMAYDLSAVPEGGLATAEGNAHPFVGPITRTGGLIFCAVQVALDDTADTDQPCDPLNWIVDCVAGSVTIPATRKPAEVTP